MEQMMLENAIRRIRKMEVLFDALQQTDGQNRSNFQSQLHTLLQYYESGLWLQDYRLDEEGYLPPDLKRGVLSEDGVYQFLSELDCERSLE